MVLVGPHQINRIAEREDRGPEEAVKGVNPPPRLARVVGAIKMRTRRLPLGRTRPKLVVLCKIDAISQNRDARRTDVFFGALRDMADDRSGDVRNVGSLRNT